MKIFISGGCKNGKSYYGEYFAVNKQKKNMPLYYVATMIPSDKEDEERIMRHQQNRKDKGFLTIECSENIHLVLKQCNIKGSFLLDSITALLANEMFGQDGNMLNEAPQKVAKELCSFAEAVDNIVFVSDYIYADYGPYEKETESYRKGLAFLDKKIAKLCDVVIEVFFGNLLIYKGKERLEEWK